MTQAQARLNELMIAHTPASPGARVLDVGCGTGTPAIALAQRTSCAVVGITISNEQTQIAKQRAAAEHLSDRDRLQTLREMARVLQPNGRVVLTDVIEKRPMTARDRAIMYSIFHYRTLERLDRYPALLQQAGLCVLDVTANVRPSLARLAELVKQRRDEISRTYGKVFVAAMLRIFPRVIEIYEKKIGYVLALAQKPLGTSKQEEYYEHGHHRSR